jgi:predicted phage terminase large subunit-like protein
LQKLSPVNEVKQNIKYLKAMLYLRLQVEDQEASLRSFIKAAWPHVEPGVPYLHSWHIDAIADHLQALSERKIRRLIINISPRSAKSTLVSVIWPAWRWINDPAEKFFAVSYSSAITIRDSRRCRALIRSPWYQNNWGRKFAIVKDQNEKGRFENDKSGYRIAASVDGTVTGEGGTVRIMDDVNDLKTIDSDTIRNAAIDFYDGVLASRSIDPSRDIELCIQQRCHQQDMTAHLLEHGGWELLSIPMEYEGKTMVTSIGWQDPRTQMGELMHPERFNQEAIDRLKMQLGPHRFSGQFLQRPTAAEGGQLKREYWRFWHQRDEDPDTVRVPIAPGKVLEKRTEPIPEAFEQVLQSWDLAFKDQEHNDFVSGQAWGRVGANIFLLSRRHGHFDFVRTLKEIRDMSVHFPCPEKLVEDKANGPAVIATLRNEIPGLIPINPEGGKVSRVNAISGYCEAGNVFLPNPNRHPWVWDLIEEWANFPVAAHDDDTDAFAQAARRLFDAMANSAAPEFRVSPRLGEPETACHVKDDWTIQRELLPHWRRWIAVSPGAPGAVLWICETPSQSLRVYREMSLGGIDAHEAGRLIAAATLPDVQAFCTSPHRTAKWNIDLLLEKEAFTPIEPIGSYAELLEQGILSYEPTDGSWEERQIAKAALQSAKLSAQMAETDESAWDRCGNFYDSSPLSSRN